MRDRGLTPMVTPGLAGTPSRGTPGDSAVTTRPCSGAVTSISPEPGERRCRRVGGHVVPAPGIAVEQVPSNRRVLGFSLEDEA